MATPKYYWRISRDHLAEKDCKVHGPANADTTLRTNGKKFELFDCDRERYFSGKIFGDYDGFEPLDDFGRDACGCTDIKINGRWL